jgi:LuxR family maltose regulon positive regulatory protein
VTLLRVAEGRLAYLRGDVIGARDLLVRAAELARVTGHPSQMLRALITLADAQLAAGDRAAARTALDEAQEIADSWTVQPGTTQRLIDAQARVGRRAARAALREHRMAEALTDRELSILRTLQGPLTQREIASELFLSVNTVKGYTKSLYRKLGVAARSEAIERGRELGFI